MVSLAQLSLVLMLAPFVAGLLLTVLGARLARGVALGIAILVAVVAAIAAITLGASTLPDTPQIIVLLVVNQHGWTQRIDSLTAYLTVGVTVWVMPVLIWVTTPRKTSGEAPQAYSMRPMGLALIAASLALGAVLDDNIVLIAVCWAGVGFVAWLIARPEGELIPRDPQEWLDLSLMTVGPVLFGLVMIFPMAGGKTLSLFDMAGRNLVSFVPTLLLVLVLAFASGVYPFTIWVRRVTQGVMTEASAVLLLLSTPLAVVLLGRLMAVVETNGSWPSWLIGAAVIPVSVLLPILGIVTVIACGVVLLFETDLPVITSMLGTMALGWCFIAVGSRDDHALVGLVLLLGAYVLAVGTLMAVVTSLEWLDRELIVARLPGMARDLPFHFSALALAALTLAGVPFLSGFAGMAPIDQGLLSIGGAMTLGGALIWGANALALLAVLRLLGMALSHSDDTAIADNAPDRRLGLREGALLLVPAALLLVGGIAPELLLFGTSPAQNPVVSAAAALSATSTVIPDVTTTAFGFGVSAALWLPGLLWVLAIVVAAVVYVASGLAGVSAVLSRVFAGGAPYAPAMSEELLSWNDLTAIARFPLVMPGPASWREDLGEMDEEPEYGEEEEEEPQAEEEGELADDEIVVVEDEEVVILEEDDEIPASDEEPSAEEPSAEDEIAPGNQADDLTRPAGETGAPEDLAEPASETSKADEPKEADDAPPASDAPRAQSPAPSPPTSSARNAGASRRDGKGGKRGRR